MLAPNYALLPGESSVYETNADGFPAAADPFAAATGYSDPFSYTVGFLDDPSVNDPMRSSHLPMPGGHGPGGGNIYYTPGEGYSASPTSDASTGPAPDISGYDSEQIANAQAIIDTGHEVGASERDIQVAIMAAMVESNMRNLDHGDRDSIGMFQQRDAWGSREDRLDPHKSARMFFLGGNGGQQGLLDIPNRDSVPMGDLAQDVQVSAFPDRYAEHEADAAAVLNSVASESRGVQDRAYVGPYKPDELLKRAEQLAAAGDTDPFFHSVTDGWYRKCQHAVANLSGKAFSGYDTASEAWNHFESTGAAHPVTGPDGSEPPVGAWLYYSGSSAAGHVAVYLGDGKVASTDAFGSGRVGIGRMEELTDGAWRLNYLGWAAPWGQGKIKKLDTPKESGVDTAALTPEDEGWRSHIVRQAKTFLGTPFKWGGEDYDGVDNYGFIKDVYRSLGIDLPGHGVELVTLDRPDLPAPVPIEDAKPGDIIAWDAHPETGTAHVGILTAQNEVISAVRPGRPVQLSVLGDVTSAWGIPMGPLVRLTPKRGPRPRPAPGPSPAAPTAPSAPAPGLGYNHPAPPVPESHPPASSPHSTPHHTPHNSPGPQHDPGLGYGHPLPPPPPP